MLINYYQTLSWISKNWMRHVRVCVYGVGRERENLVRDMDLKLFLIHDFS